MNNQKNEIKRWTAKRKTQVVMDILNRVLNTLAARANSCVGCAKNRGSLQIVECE